VAWLRQRAHGSRPQHCQFVSMRRPGRRETVRVALNSNNCGSGRSRTAAKAPVVSHSVETNVGSASPRECGPRSRVSASGTDRHRFTTCPARCPELVWRSQTPSSVDWRPDGVSGTTTRRSGADELVTARPPEPSRRTGSQPPDSRRWRSAPHRSPPVGARRARSAPQLPPGH
jgi:hypothetical protein